MHTEDDTALFRALTVKAEALKKNTINFVPELNPAGNIDIVFADGSRLSALLPSKVSISHTPNIHSPETRTHFNGESVVRIVVHIDFEWLKKASAKQLAIFCHELGHAFQNSRLNEQLKQLNTEFFQEKRLPHTAAQSLTDIVLATQFSLKEVGFHLEHELVAWDNGRAYAAIFGISEEIYNFVESISIRAYDYNWTLKTRKGLENYAAQFGSLTQLPPNLDGSVARYDITTRSFSEAPFATVIAILFQLTDAEAQRLESEALKLIAA